MGLLKIKKGKFITNPKLHQNQNGKSMFPNCIDRFSRQKKNDLTQQKKTNKNKQRKIKKNKMGVIVPTMNQYQMNG